MIIDIFCHYLAKSVLPLLEKSKVYGEGKQIPYSLKNSDPELRLAHMDKYGIDIQSISTDAAEVIVFPAAIPAKNVVFIWMA